jgi:hypothetical protein
MAWDTKEHNFQAPLLPDKLDILAIQDSILVFIL